MNIFEKVTRLPKKKDDLSDLSTNLQANTKALNEVKELLIELKIKQKAEQEQKRVQPLKPLSYEVLSNRSFQLLKMHGYNYFQDLENLTREEFLSWYGAGERTWQEVKNVAEFFGFQVR